MEKRDRLQGLEEHDDALTEHMVLEVVFHGTHFLHSWIAALIFCHHCLDGTLICYLATVV